MIGSSGQYSIELWTDPANVTQTKADRGLLCGQPERGQLLLRAGRLPVPGLRRSSSTGLDGTPPLLPTQRRHGILAQAALQHVVITYDPTHGRQLVDGLPTAQRSPA